MQLDVQFSQRQIGLRSNPCSYLTLRLNPGVRLAPRPVWHALGLTTALALCGNLLCPANTDQKAGRQLFQRTLALVVGQQKLTAQIIPIGSPHLFTRRRQSPQLVYTITGNALDEILGPDYRELRALPHEEQEEEAVRRYCDLVRRQGGFRYVCALPVMKADQDAIHFYLIYGTRNAKGIEVFKQVERKTEQETEVVRATIQQSKRINLDLFEPDVLYKRQERYIRLTARSNKHAKAALDTLLSERRNVPYDDCWAEVLQFPTVHESDLREWLKEKEAIGSISVSGRNKPNEALRRRNDQTIVSRQN